MTGKNTSSIVAQLNRTVVINIGLFVLLAFFVFAATLIVQYQHKILFDYVTERRTLGQLDSLVTDTASKILALMITREAAEAEAEAVYILARSEDFQSAFDSYYDAVFTRNSITELSLAREFEPVITALRVDIVRTMSLLRAQDFTSARNFYFSSLSIRINQVKHFTTDEIYRLDKLIADKKTTVSSLEIFSAIFVVFVTAGLAVLVFRRSMDLAKAISLPIEKLMTGISVIAKGGYGIKVETVANDEFGRLTDRLNSMSEEIHKSRQSLIEARAMAESYQRKLVESNKMASLGAMSSGIAHELNQPLGAILLKIDLLPRLIDRGGAARLKTIVEDMRHQLLRAQKIMTSLRIFSREDTAQDRERCNINDIVEDILTLFHDEFRLMGVDLKVSLTSQEAVIFVSSVQVGQVLSSILANARDAVRENDALKTVAINTVRANGKAVMEIIDNGHGIAQEHLDRIYEPFFTTKDIGKGTGLGLSLSYSMIQENGGEISVTSEEGKGTRFKLTFSAV